MQQLRRVENPQRPPIYDTDQCRYDGLEVSFTNPVVDENGKVVETGSITVDGKTIKIYAEKDAANCPWAANNVDVVLECTGFYCSTEKSMAHITAGAKKVVISAPAGKDLKTIVFSVNEDTLTPDDKIISAASCTTNCLAPMAKALNDYAPVQSGIMTTVHFISPMIALGMILVASCPGGNVSNFITSLSRGNSELSVSLTAFNTAACIFTTPINFAFWGKLYLNFANNHNIGELPELQIPFWEIFQSIVIIMGIPLVLGMLCGQYLPKVTKLLKKPLQYLSIAVFIAMVILIFVGNFDAFMRCIKYIFLVVFLHNLLALGIGFGTSTMLKLPYKDRRTLTIETGIQNSGLGLILLLNPNIFPDAGVWANNGGMLVITAWWGVWHIVSGLTLAYTWRIRGRKEAIEE